jgi:hypothetical protein
LTRLRRVDAEVAEKGHFWMETRYILCKAGNNKGLFTLKKGSLDKSYPHFLK